MGVADLTIRQGDTLPAFPVTILDSSGSPLNLAGATVTLVMRQALSSLPALSAPMTVTNPTAGQVVYNWGASDTANAGLFDAEIHVALSGGGSYTYPNDGYLTVQVEENLLSQNQTIVTLADAKDTLIIDASDKTQDAKILRFLRGMQVVIEAHIGPVIVRTFDEWYDGGTPYVRLIHRPTLAQGADPVMTLMSCSEYVGPIEWPLHVVSTPAQGSLYSCMLDRQTGTVVRRTAGGGVQAFPPMPLSVHAIYQAGLKSVPVNIYEGSLDFLRENFRKTAQVGGFDSMNNSDQVTADVLGSVLSDRVRQWIGPMKKHPSVA